LLLSSQGTQQTNHNLNDAGSLHTRASIAKSSIIVGLEDNTKRNLGQIEGAGASLFN